MTLASRRPGRRGADWCALALALTLAAPGCPSSAPRAADTSTVSASPAVEVVEPIYDGGLKGSWQTQGSAPSELVAGSPAKVRFDGKVEWILARPGLSGAFGGVVFRVKVVPGDGEFLEVGLRSGPGGAGGPLFVKVSPDHRRVLADNWVEVTIPIEQLDPQRRPFDRVVFRAFRPVGAEWVSIDQVGLLRASSVSSGGAPPAAGGGPPPAPAAGGPTPMRIACDARPAKISPFIYGVAFTDVGHFPTEIGATIRRWGGNRSTRYNWEGHFDNSASDWFFENHPAGDWAQFVSTNGAQSKAGAITVPTIGWVAKDGSSHSFPVSVFGAQAHTDPYRPDAGDGTKPSGDKIPPGPPDRTSTPAPPEWVKHWVEAVRAAEAKSGARSTREYILDNEPMLWNATHRDVHPEPVGYDELLDRTIRYGEAVRAADPEALIAGPAEWGWSGYLFSAKDLAPGAVGKPDRAAHGGVDLVEWYLSSLRQREQKTGVKILDVLDLHYYPQASGVYSDASDPKTAELRLQSTRSLWDPTYVDPSWIHEPVRLLPRMREWVDKNYPGRGISIGEWNFGGEKHISGALATAEALGRFAQFGVASAFYWTVPPPGSPGAQGFLAYRNFDGKGGHFLDGYLPTTSPPGVSLFASRDDEGKHVVAVAINMLQETRLAQVDVGTCNSIASVRAYVYTGASPAFVGATAPAVGTPTLAQSLPPWSITVLDVQLTEPLPKP